MTLHQKPPNATDWRTRSMAVGARHLLEQRPADLSGARAEAGSCQRNRIRGEAELPVWLHRYIGIAFSAA
jgi:hypothetical protein